jgi:hypothetical protein
MRWRLQAQQKLHSPWAMEREVYGRTFDPCLVCGAPGTYRGSVTGRRWCEPCIREPDIIASAKKADDWFLRVQED